MEIENDLKLKVSELIFWEATLLDRRRWEEWIELYSEDAVFWVPSWADEENTTDDPETQLNLMYFSSRSGSEDRGRRAGRHPKGSPPTGSRRRRRCQTHLMA